MGGQADQVLILKANTSTLQELVVRYDVMQSVNDVVTNVGGVQPFEATYLPVLERFADRVQEVPLQKGVFSEPGGAFLSGVLSASLAVRSCDATIFAPDATASQRMTNDRHYRWLAYCATLATVYLIAAGSVTPISDKDSYCWASSTPLQRWRPAYTILWVERPTYVLGRLMPYLSSFMFDDQLSHLSRTLIADFGAAINPALTATSAEAPLTRVVRASIERVIADERNKQSKWVSHSPTNQTNQQAAADAVPTHTSAPDQHTEQSNSQNNAELCESQSKSQPPPSPSQTKATEWLVALASIPAIEGQATVLPDGKLLLTRKALGFGALPSLNFKLLHEAGWVDVKSETSVTLKSIAGNIFKEAKKESA